MVTRYKITSAITDGLDLTITAKCSEPTGTRKDEFGKGIAILKYRDVTVVIPITDLSKSNKLVYIKTQIELAYDALPDETLVKSLIGKVWST